MELLFISLQLFLKINAFENAVMSLNNSVRYGQVFLHNFVEHHHEGSIILESQVKKWPSAIAFMGKSILLKL